MKIRYDATLISATLISICLVGMIPGSLRFASTWRELYLYDLPDRGGAELSNAPWLLLSRDGDQWFDCPLDGFRKKERWAWFVMLTILAFFLFPPYLLTLIVKPHEWKLGLADLWPLARAAWEGDSEAIGIVLGAVTFFVVLASLLLPLRTFFWKSARSCRDA
jgi:hypothetical protein